MGKKLTPEERKTRKAQREREQEEERQRYPTARLHITGAETPRWWIQLALDTDTPNVLSIEKLGDIPWFKCRDHVTEVSLHLGHDIETLAGFIRALVLRYNALVDEINEEAAATPPLKQIEAIEQGTTDAPSQNQAQINLDMPTLQNRITESPGEIQTETKEEKPQWPAPFGPRP